MSCGQCGHSITANMQRRGKISQVLPIGSLTAFLEDLMVRE